MIELKVTPNKAFWFCYFLFCLVSTLGAQLTGAIDVPTMSRAEHLIFISALILSGIVFRYWFTANYKEAARKEQQ